MAQIAAGKFRPLPVTAPQRGAERADLPNVPTLAEAGVRGAEAELWLGFFGPAGLPQAVRDTLNQELNRYLALPETRQRLAATAYAPAGGTPQALTDLIAGETARWAEVVRFANLQQG